MQLADIKDLKELRDFVSKNEYLYSVSGRKTKFPSRFLNWMTKEDLNGFFAISSYKAINPIEHYVLFDEEGISEFEKEYVGIKVASEFTRYIIPSHSQLPMTSLRLRDEYLIPLITNNPDKKLVIDLDGMDHVYPSVLEDIFTGLVKMMGERTREKVEMVCHDEEILQNLNSINWQGKGKDDF